MFAAITVDGRVRVYDLYVDHFKPLCTQLIVSRKKATLNNIKFNTIHPIILVGDSLGDVHCYKLSPNLRRKLDPKVLGINIGEFGNIEIWKMHRILEQMRPDDLGREEDLLN